MKYIYKSALHGRIKQRNRPVTNRYVSGLYFNKNQLFSKFAPCPQSIETRPKDRNTASGSTQTHTKYLHDTLARATFCADTMQFYCAPPMGLACMGTRKLHANADTILTACNGVVWSSRQQRAAAHGETEMVCKLVRISHGNPCYLGFGVNTKIELPEDMWAYDGSFVRGAKLLPDDHIAVKLYGALMGLNLVEEVTVRAYEISVKFCDAFEDDDAERSRLFHEATEIIISIVFGGQPVAISDKDDRQKYARSEDDAA